jgi:hypothetical protein
MGRDGSEEGGTSRGGGWGDGELGAGGGTSFGGLGSSVFILKITF